MKIALKNSVLSLLIILWGLNAYASTATLHWDSSTGEVYGNSIELDNNGGENSNMVYYFDGLKMTSDTDFMVSDGTNIDHADFPDSDEEEVYPYNFDHDASGINILSSDLDFGNVDTIFGASNSPLTPVHYSGNNTGFTIDQLAYIEDTADFVILEFKITNTQTDAIDIYAAMANDWDVVTSENNFSDFDEEHNLIFQTNASAGYAMGLTVLVDTPDEHRMGYCCGLTDSHFDEASEDLQLADKYVFVKGFLFDTIETEECDDGNTDNNDGCSADCKTEAAASTCGNGTLETGEACDDSNTDNGDGCSDSCLSEDCGNGTLDADEACEDSNTANGDGCSRFCTPEFYATDRNSFCGDGFVNGGGVGEQFDINQSSDTETSISIKFEAVPTDEARTAAFCLVAGKGTPDTEENITDLQDKIDACSAYYATNIAVCGNGVQNAGEECDDGNTTSDDGCSSTCTVDTDLPVCGDSTVDEDEECDDGNTTDGDGCSSTCAVEGSGGGGCALNTVEGGSAYLPFAALAACGAWLLMVRRKNQSRNS